MNVFLWNARARNGHVEATLNHPFPAQARGAGGAVYAWGDAPAKPYTTKQTVVELYGPGLEFAENRNGYRADFASVRGGGAVAVGNGVDLVAVKHEHVHEAGADGLLVLDDEQAAFTGHGDTGRGSEGSEKASSLASPPHVNVP